MASNSCDRNSNPVFPSCNLPSLPLHLPRSPPPFFHTSLSQHIPLTCHCLSSSICLSPPVILPPSRPDPLSLSPSHADQFPSLQSKMRVVLRVEVEAVKFLKEEPHRLDALLKRCNTMTDALSTLRRYTYQTLLSVLR